MRDVGTREIRKHVAERLRERKNEIRDAWADYVVASEQCGTSCVVRSDGPAASNALLIGWPASARRER